MKNEAIIVETTSYTNFEAFCEVVMRVVDARAQVSSIVGVERIGLRYVLEVRVPVGVDGRIEWANWIAEPLIGPQRIAPSGLALTEWQGAAVYREAQPGKSLIIRYGPGIGQALDQNYHLRRITPAQAGAVFPDGYRQLLDPGRVHPRIQQGSAGLRPSRICTNRRRPCFRRCSPAA